MRVRWLSLGLALLCLAPPLRADEPKADTKTYQVPYRLTDTMHVLVRVKINGKGPFNFIIDTGAPALFVSTAVCTKLGIKPGRDGWGTFDRFEVEGGVVESKARGRVEDLFQLRGMNALGVAGAELHGIIGYTVLARYRLEFDFTRDKMAWTRLDFEPPPPAGMRGKGGQHPGLEAMGTIMQVMGALLGTPPAPEVAPRGFFGMELADADGAVTVKAVLADSPAARAGLKPGDRIAEFQEREVKSVADVRRLAAKITGGQTVPLTVKRGTASHQFSVKTGEGL